MTHDPRFDILFESVRLGPVTAPNRFYQVPHCTGIGYTHPEMPAAMREVKAESGWGVVNTEYCSIHPSSDDMPAPFCSLWDDGDVCNMARMVEGVHRHGALAGVELWYGGQRSSNNHSRMLPSLQTACRCQEHRGNVRPWTKPISKLIATGTVPRSCGPKKRASTSSMFMPPTLICWRNFSIRKSTGVPMNMAARLRSRLLREVLEETRAAIGRTSAIATRVEVLNEDGGGKNERSELL